MKKLSDSNFSDISAYFSSAKTILVISPDITEVCFNKLKNFKEELYE